MKKIILFDATGKRIEAFIDETGQQQSKEKKRNEIKDWVQISFFALSAIMTTISLYILVKNKRRAS